MFSSRVVLKSFLESARYLCILVWSFQRFWDVVLVFWLLRTAWQVDLLCVTSGSRRQKWGRQEGFSEELRRIIWIYKDLVIYHVHIFPRDNISCLLEVLITVRSRSFVLLSPVWVIMVIPLSLWVTLSLFQEDSGWGFHRAQMKRFFFFLLNKRVQKLSGV
jgi:hypothetical protein